MRNRRRVTTESGRGLLARLWKSAIVKGKVAGMKNVALVLLLTVYAAAIVAPQSKETPHNPAGSIEGGNKYVNPVLALRVTLPGKWRLMTPAKYAQNGPTAEPAPDSGCRVPLCGKPDIDAALETVSIPEQTLFLNAYKLQPEYLNRQRYPLSRFAEVMMQGSLAGSDWVPVGGMSQVQIAGRQAYRLLVHDPSKPRKNGFGLVFESNGYVCLLVGTDITAAQNLLPAVQDMAGQ